MYFPLPGKQCTYPHRVCGVGRRARLPCQPHSQCRQGNSNTIHPTLPGLMFSNTTHPTLPGLMFLVSLLPVTVRLFPGPVLQGRSRCSLPCLSLLVFHFIRPYFHNQQFGGMGGEGRGVICHLAVAAKGWVSPAIPMASRGWGSMDCPHYHAHVAAGHCQQTLGWQETRLALGTKKGTELSGLGPGAVPAVLLLATSVIRKNNKIKNRCKEQCAFFFVQLSCRE